MKKINTSPYEDQEQEAFIYYLDTQGFKYFAVPNANKRTFWQQRKVKKEGLKSGVPDIVILAKSASGKFNVLFMEIKRQEGGQVSEKQQEWINWLDKNEYAVCVAKGCEHAIKLFNSYLTQY